MEKNKGKLEKQKEKYAKLSEYANQSTKNVGKYKTDSEKERGLQYR